MSGKKRSRTHADDFKDLEDRAPIDFDPEDEPPNQDSSDDSAPEDEAIDGVSAREHYEPVGKSKLRQQDSASLGPQYAGSRITRRGAATVDDEHDPFAEYGSDGESDMGNDESEMEEDASEGGADGIEDDDIEDGQESGDTSFSDDDDEDMKASRQVKDDRAELRRIMDEQSNVAAAISEATRVDAEKGRAVKRQRKTFDSLLNTRIRMQQSLIAANSLQAETPQDIPEHYVAAETAALNLWNTIESLRQSLTNTPSTSTQTAQQLKVSTATPSPKIWTHMQSREAAALPTRTSTLSKWSRKTAATAAPSQQQQQHAARRLGPAGSSASPQQPDITAILADHLSSTNLPRLVARTRIPRSCAPVQARAGTAAPATTNGESNSTEPQPPIYDDADFYADLLQDLLATRQLDDLSHASAIDASIASAFKTGAGSAEGGTRGAQRNETLTAHYLALRAASKSKKTYVDTKASKGRKLRYTVHEKLQNFMAPEGEGRRLWGDKQREELFGSLLGRRVGLEEREGEAEAEGEGGGDAREGLQEEEALMLFRS